MLNAAHDFTEIQHFYFEPSYLQEIWKMQN